MWLSDKPAVQQELMLTLSKLQRELKTDSSRLLLFIKTFWITMDREWLGLDRHRLDKYMSFIRRFLGLSMRLLADSNWDGTTKFAFLL